MYIDLITIVNKMAVTDPLVFSKLSSLEIALTAGSICPSELFRKMKKIFNFKRIYVSTNKSNKPHRPFIDKTNNIWFFQSGYGMTEVSPIAFFSSPNDSENSVTTTIGNVIDHAEVMLFVRALKFHKLWS